MDRTPLFGLGRLTATPAALEVMERHAIRPFSLLERHQCGDWGVCDAEDVQTNDRAVAHGLRILSAYPIDPAKPCRGYGDNTLWIITEADRSVTTILLPSDY